MARSENRPKQPSQETIEERALRGQITTARATERSAQATEDSTAVSEGLAATAIAILEEFKAMNRTLAAIEMNTRPPGGGPQ